MMMEIGEIETVSNNAKETVYADLDETHCQHHMGVGIEIQSISLGTTCP